MAKCDDAFNAGSDARIRGEPATAYVFTDTYYRYYFGLGWESVNKSWGIDALWPVKELPPVRVAGRPLQ